MLPLLVAGIVGVAGGVGMAGMAQRGRGAGGGAAPPSARQTAPVDLTGYWVSVVSEDWRYRMLTPSKGDYGAVPLNPAGRKLADTWDPAKDRASGNECRVYGAAGVMRVPGRLRISWQDDSTLKIDTDAGQQVRLFHFGPPPPASAEPTWQGQSVASWDGVQAGDTRGRWGSLRVVTTRMRPGYLRRNGVPYSEDAVLTEYYDRHALPNGSEWFTVTTIVSDPRYLNQEFITSTDFKKEPDGSKWNPAPCETN
jgi:hypothetical protein